MKHKDFIDLKEKGVKELAKIISDKKFEEAKAKIAIGTGKEKNLKKAMKLRKEIAKILTLIKEKQIIEKLATKNIKRKDNAKANS